MQIVLLGKNKKDNDRVRRYKELLKGCKNAPQCLIKSCLYFKTVDTASPDDPMDTDDDDLYENPSDKNRAKVSPSAKIVSGTCQSLISIRKKEMDVLLAELESDLLLAEWLEQQCRRATKEEHKGSHYLRWKSDMGSTGLRDPTATSILRQCLVKASNGVDSETEEKYFRDPPTADVLKEEKKAADERKKRQKAKRAADRKAKKVDKPNKKGDKTPSPPETDDDDDFDPKPNKIDQDDFDAYARQLRALTGRLRGLVSELTSRMRSLRFARGAQELQQWHANQGTRPKCRSCGKSRHDHDAMCINISCGHLTCSRCISSSTSPVCAVNGCGEAAESFHLRKAVDLVGDGQTWEYGSRLGNIIELINTLPKDEQVLLFVQFEDLMAKMAKGLTAANISNYALGNTTEKKMTIMMNDFQDNRGESKKKVLLLNPSSEKSAGM